MKHSVLKRPINVSFVKNTYAAEQDILCLANYEGLFGSFFRISMDNYEINELIRYPNWNDSYPSVVWSYIIGIQDNIIVFCPRWYVETKNIILYDLNTTKSELIEIEDKKLLDSPSHVRVSKWWANETYNAILSPRFNKVYFYDESIFVIPNSYPQILQVNLITKVVEYISILPEMKQKKERDTYLFGESIQLKDKIYFTNKFSNILIEFDLQTKKNQIIQLGEDSLGNAMIACDTDCIWCFSTDWSRLLRWDSVTKRITKFKNIKSNQGEYRQYSALIFKDHYIYMTTCNADYLPVRLNIELGEIEPVKTLVQKLLPYEYVLSFAEVNNDFYFSTNLGNIYKWITDENSFPVFHCSVESVVAEEIERQIHVFYEKGKDKFEETDWYGLEEFLQLIEGEKERERNEEQQNYGLQIFNSLC